jgi:type II secretory pathway predicted ATPase ExeA
MYQAYWGLSRPAFTTVGDPGWYFLSPTHEEAQARLDFLVQNQRRLGVLLGPSGVGKSMTLAWFAQRLRRQRAEVVLLSLLGMDNDEFLWRLAVRFGASDRKSIVAARAWQAVEDRLVVNQFQRIPTVFLLDDAEQADHDILRSIHRLVHVEPGSQAAVTLVLAAHSQRAPLLGSRLLELADLKVELEPWDLWQTTSFVQSSLELAGRRGPIFTTAALQRLQILAQGQPRRVVQLAELALVAGSAQQLERIDDSLLDSTSDQLTLAAALDSWA